MIETYTSETQDALTISVPIMQGTKSEVVYIPRYTFDATEEPEITIEEETFDVLKDYTAFTLDPVSGLYTFTVDLTASPDLGILPKTINARTG